MADTVPPKGTRPLAGTARPGLRLSRRGRWLLAALALGVAAWAAAAWLAATLL